MSKWYELHIKNEILFWFIMISILPILLLFSANYLLQKNQFKTQAQDHLELILNEKIAKLETQIDDFEKNVKLISSIPSIIDGFEQAQKSFKQNSQTLKESVDPNQNDRYFFR